MGESEQGGRFDTDAGALERRLQAHERFGSEDINDWIFQHLEAGEGMSVLELGCGSGHQTIPLAQTLGEKGRILAVDVSPEALSRLAESAADAGVRHRIELLEVDFSDLFRVGHPRKFDRALAAFSLYYAKDPHGLIQGVAERLVDGGNFFFCGPEPGNNFQIKQFHYDLLGTDAADLSDPVETFMEGTGISVAEACFDDVERYHFTNTLNFKSVGALMDYWRSYNLYDPELQDDFERAARDHFRRRSEFSTVKKTLGIKALKGGRPGKSAG